MAILMKGAEVSAGMEGRLRAGLAELRGRGIEPRLAIVRVGEEAGNLAYERGALKRFEKLGMAAQVHAFPAGISQAEFDGEFAKINGDPSVHGVLLLRPLPGGLDDAPARRSADPRKDVDGMSPENQAKIFAGEEGGVAPCTPGAVMEILAHYGVGLEGKNVVIVGRSLVLGRTLSLMMLAANATVTVCHSRTPNLAEHCRRADVLVTAAGRAGLIGPGCVTERSVVVDVGINAGPGGKLCGDVDFDAVVSLVSMITPVPGGMGAVTTSVLARNTLLAAGMLNGGVVK